MKSWPGHLDIINKVSLDILLMLDSLEPRKITPGFSGINVNGIKVGEWETSDDLFQDGCSDIVAGVWVEPPFPATSRYMFFLDGVIKRKFLDRPMKSNHIPEWELAVENGIADNMRSAGDIVRTQVYGKAGIVDIVNYTRKSIVEVKAAGDRSKIFTAAEQLKRYEKDHPGFSQYIGLPKSHIPLWILNALSAIDVGIIFPDDDDESSPSAETLAKAAEIATWINDRIEPKDRTKVEYWLQKCDSKDVAEAIKRRMEGV